MFSSCSLVLSEIVLEKLGQMIFILFPYRIVAVWGCAVTQTLSD
jgi:hypothetical protein